MRSRQRRIEIYEKRLDDLHDKLEKLYPSYDSRAPGSNKEEIGQDIQGIEEEIERLEAKLKVLRAGGEAPLEDLDEEFDELEDNAPARWDDELRGKYLEQFIKRYGEIRDWDATNVYVEPDLATTDPQRPPKKSEQNQPEAILQQDPRKLYPHSIKYTSLLEEIMEDSRRRNWIILGEAGIGKTTLLERVGVEFAKRTHQDKNRPLPIFIKLAGYATHIQQPRQQALKVDALTLLSRYIASILKDYFRMSISADEISEGLRDGKYVLLLDALDEIGRPDLREKILQSINDVLQNYADSRIIITLRTTGYQDSYFSSLNKSIRTLLPFSPGQCKEYINKQLGGESIGRANKLYKALDNPRFQYLLSRPFLLWLMVEWLRRQPEDNGTAIPDSRVKLYSQFVKYLINERAQKLKEQEGEQLSADDLEIQIRQYLAYIAYILHTASDQYIHKDTLTKCVQKISPHLSAEQIERYFVPNAGVLQKVDDYYYTFSHFTFQEFFTAEYFKVHDGKEEREQLFTRSMDPWWHEVLVIYNAFHSDNWLLQKLMTENDNIFATRLLLAVDCFKAIPWTKEEVHEEIPRLRDQAYRKLRERYYRCKYTQLQDVLFEGLQRLDERLFMSFLEDQLKQFEDKYRKRAIKALGQLGARDFRRTAFESAELQKLDDLLNTVYEGSDRLAVIKALINLDTEKDQQTILQWLREDRPHAPYVVRELIHAEREDFVKILLDILFDLRTPHWVSHTIREQLGKVRSPLIQQGFQEVLASTIECNDTSRIIELLRAISFPVDDDMKKDILSLFTSQDVDLLQAVVYFLGNQAICSMSQKPEDYSVIEQLFHLLFERNLDDVSHKEREDLYWEILCALIKLNTPDAIYYITEHLKTAPSDLKWTKVIDTAREFGGIESFHFLANQLKSLLEDGISSPDRKMAMIFALYQIAFRLGPICELSQDLCQQIQRYLVISSGNNELVEAAVYLLFKYADNAQKMALFELVLHGHRAEIGKEIARYLLNHKRQIEIGQLKNYYLRTRHSDLLVYQLVIHISPREELRSLLLQDLENSDRDICSIALDMIPLAIAKFGMGTDKELLQVLYDLLYSSYNEVVKKTILLLGEFGKDEGLITKLCPFLDGPEHELAFGALYELAKRNSWFGNAAFMEKLDGEATNL